MLIRVFRKACALILTASLLLCAITLVGCEEESTSSEGSASIKNGKVLLISIDGMRSDAVSNTEYGKTLMTTCSYSLGMRTVSPSITLPTHMSMFHSTLPDSHGVETNEYTPSEGLGFGITEALLSSGKTSDMYYNWEPIGRLSTEGSTVVSKFIDGGPVGWESSNTMLAEACIQKIKEDPADFTFLYMGFVDEWGHRYGWMSDEYYYALNQSLGLVERVIEELSDDYTVIITADHGGHDNTHGTTLDEDMTIPVMVLEKGEQAFEVASMLDVAPTVLEVLDVEAPEYWLGKVLK